jgi:hypothetical protein
MLGTAMHSLLMFGTLGTGMRSLHMSAIAQMVGNPP